MNKTLLNTALTTHANRKTTKNKQQNKQKKFISGWERVREKQTQIFTTHKYFKKNAFYPADKTSVTT